MSTIQNRRTAAAKARAGKSKSQLSADDWIRAASSVLAEEGVDAVRVEPIAQRLGVTKGSFYHHFSDRAELRRAILDSWRRRATRGIIDRLNDNEATPRDRLIGVVTLPTRGRRSKEAANLEQAIRLWAKKDKDAYRVQSEVDEQRLSFIAGLFEAYGFPVEKARARAFVLYAATMAQTMFAINDMDQRRPSIIDELLSD